MNGMDNPIIFYPAAMLMILSAVLAIKFKNIFYSLLFAILVFFSAGLFFYLLGSEYNAIIQIAIYGVAVPVILGLAIMFTDLRNDDSEKNKPNVLLNILLFILGTIFVLAMLFVISPYNFEIISISEVNPQGNLSAFSEGIFINYVWAFELISIILTIIIAGLAMLMKNKDESEATCKK